MQWMLPDGVDEVLPPAGWQLEALRRQVLDEFHSWGYELILPPVIEHADALLSGVGADLDLQTYRLTDQLSGRQLALRADITPQAARIDARSKANVSRLCYLGTVVRTRPGTAGGPRSLRQLGAELFGEPGVIADAEIVGLMLGVLGRCGVADVHLDVGHVGVFRAVAQQLQLDAQDEQAVFELLQAKARDDLHAWVASRGLSAGDVLKWLATAYGDGSVLADARERLVPQVPAVAAALDELEALHSHLKALYPNLPVHVDLAELRGYRYQTGVVFAAFIPGYGRELARGGRYDGVGAVFGAGRPATGFSADLNALSAFGARAAGPDDVILAPLVADPALNEFVTELRAGGARVRWCYTVPADAAAVIEHDGTRWHVRRQQDEQ